MIQRISILSPSRPLLRQLREKEVQSLAVVARGTPTTTLIMNTLLLLLVAMIGSLQLVSIFYQLVFVLVLSGQFKCEDQSVLELRKTVYALHDIKLMMQVSVDSVNQWFNHLILISQLSWVQCFLNCSLNFVMSRLAFEWVVLCFTTLLSKIKVPFVNSLDHEKNC